LNIAIGMPQAPDYAVVDVLSYEAMNVDLDATLKAAYDRRQDLLSLAARKRSLEESISLARKGYYPSVSGNANFSWGGTDSALGRGWTVGAQVDIPLFSGYSTKYQVEEAQANLGVVMANEASLRQTIYQDVRQAWLNLTAAGEQITTAEVSVRQATENLDLANGRYGAGVGSPLEVTDAVVAASNAKTAYTSALYDYRIAQANLEKAMGER
jgi:outer membrane protein